MPNESVRAKLYLNRLLPNVTCLFLLASGLIILAWVGWLTWHDTTSWGKGVFLIFFGSRTGEAISLGIGMKVIYYFLISLALLLSGLVTLLQKRSKGLNLFGYLASLSRNVTIPRDLIGRLARARAKLIADIALISMLGVSLYLSPLRNNTVAVVGVFASLSAVITALLATTEIEIVSVEEERTARKITSRRENLPYETLNYTAKPLNFSYTRMSSAKTSEFNVDISSSEHHVTLSSQYVPTRAHRTELPHKERQVLRRNINRLHRDTRGD